MRLLVALAAIVVAVVAGVSLLNQRFGAHPRALESIFQDDQLLIYQPLTPAGTAEVQHTLETLRSLGVDRLRLIIQWGYIAPDPRPPGFNGADPAAYPAVNWASYDRIDRLAHADGLGVDFDLTAPGPLWAMSSGAPNAKTATHYEPSAADFGQFAQAVGRRYDGSYVAPGSTGPLPRVSFWSIWNEPNQPGWLAPQWGTGPGGALVPESARLYRELADAGFTGLYSTGHTPGRDTLLFGELAPEGSETRIAEAPITPMPFLRALYCVDSGYRPLRGPSAAALGCPAGGSREAFVRANPALFQASGFAHHPYSFYLPPGTSITADRNDVPLSDLGRLERGLDRAFSAYAVARRLPIYLTEYGYETNPPNPFRPTTLRQQSRYINQADYMAWLDPRVRSTAQFLLHDTPPDSAYPPDTVRYWSTFQTGLEFADGRPKPAQSAYRLPIFLPATTVAPGGSLLVWGMLRPAANRTRQAALIQWRPPHGKYRTIATVTTSNPTGILTARVPVPGSGAIRIAWAARPGIHSRAVGVGVSAG